MVFGECFSGNYIDLTIKAIYPDIEDIHRENQVLCSPRIRCYIYSKSSVEYRFYIRISCYVDQDLE